MGQPSCSTPLALPQRTFEEALEELEDPSEVRRQDSDVDRASGFVLAEEVRVQGSGRPQREWVLCLLGDEVRGYTRFSCSTADTDSPGCPSIY